MTGKLNKDKPYAVVRGTGNIDGHTGVRYMQDGKYFSGDGSPAKRSHTVAPVAPVAAKAPSAPAKAARATKRNKAAPTKAPSAPVEAVNTPAAS